MHDGTSRRFLNQDEFEELMQEIFNKLNEHITDADLYDGSFYSYYVLGNNGEVLNDDWNGVFKDYPDGVEAMFMAYTNDLDSVENLSKIPIEEWGPSADKLCNDNQDDLDFVYYTESR